MHRKFSVEFKCNKKSENDCVNQCNGKMTDVMLIWLELSENGDSGSGSGIMLGQLMA